MNLYLMRHGEALSKSEARVSTDAERPLAPDGIRTVEGMAKRLKALRTRGVAYVLTSPLLRAMQTAELVVKGLGTPSRVELCDALAPDAEPERFVAALKGRNGAEAVVAVGHQPLLGRIVARLAFAAKRDSLTIQPAGVVWLELPEFPASEVGVMRGFWNPESLGV